MQECTQEQERALIQGQTMEWERVKHQRNLTLDNSVRQYLHRRVTRDGTLSQYGGHNDRLTARDDLSHQVKHRRQSNQWEQ